MPAHRDGPRRGSRWRHSCLATGLLIGGLWLMPAAAGAESLRCTRGSVSEGDSRLSLVYKCGEPQLRDAYCARVYYPGTLEVVPPEIALSVVPCVPEEAWLYERGPGELAATVYLRAGTVRSIIYGQPR